MQVRAFVISFPDLRPYILTKNIAEKSIVVGGGGGGIKPSLPPITINPALYSCYPALIVFRASTLEVRFNL